MFPRLVHIYGPVWIQSYGVMIALGFLLFLYLAAKHPQRKKYINKDDFFNVVFYGLFGGIVGGRVLHVLAYPEIFYMHPIEILCPWVGGFAILGAITGALLTGIGFLLWHSITLLPVLDVAALYAPIMQVFGRIGCFLSGCCYGLITTSPFGITFHNPYGMAPIGVMIHPTQLYMSLASGLIFFILNYKQKQTLRKPGYMLLRYLFLESLSRFIIDFWRGDRVITYMGNFFSKNVYFSDMQLISIIFMVASIIVGIFFRQHYFSPYNRSN